MTIIENPADVQLYPETLERSYEPNVAPWRLPEGKKLVVSLLLHAPSYQDDVPPGTIKPIAMQGGVGRETGEPRHGQVARLSQWDFGLGVGIFRLMKIADAAGVPYAVALDEAGVTAYPALAKHVAASGAELVVRGRAANVLLGESMSREEQIAYISGARAAVEGAVGASAVGWFSPERGETTITPELLAEQGFVWNGSWPVDERPVPLVGPAAGLTALPFHLDSEDMFALYGRGLAFRDYERQLLQTVDQLIADADLLGGRFLGLSWFGWVLGQACYADVAERVLADLIARPEIAFVTPADAVRLASAAA
ncbi:MAG TPA: hypothetical protein VGC45_02585 [Gryllotalpicola sp.]